MRGVERGSIVLTGGETMKYDGHGNAMMTIREACFYSGTDA